MDTKAEIKIINDIKGYGFIIPPYQRLYAWKDEQIKALLDDFKNCIEHNKNQKEQKSHFIGNIVVAEDYGKYVLIDGQQRLTTIWLVLRYLLQGKFKKEDYFDIEMPIREEDIQAINNYCKGKTLDECFNEKNNTNVGFKNAFKCFEVYFGKDNEEDKQQFIKFIKGQVKFNLVILGDQVELNKYFVRMNNTGVQLDGTDILKARLLKLISDYEEKQNNTNKTSDCENKKSKDKTNKESKVTKYARIFDECSQMNYFAFCYEDKNQNSSIENKNLSIKDIIDNHKINKEKDKKQKRAEFESIIDFPTFVLHVFKILSKSYEKIFKKETQISIKKDKFLENTWECLDFDNNCGALTAIKTIRALKKYRIIFDTFVIKRKSGDDENVYKLWNKNNNWNEVSEANDLAIIQNYLRVARRGDNANYHHFLTHYLEFCKNEIINEQKEITNENCLEILKSNAGNLRKYLKSIDDFLALKQFSMENGENKQDLISIISKVPFNTIFSEQAKDILESIKNLNFENAEKDKGKSNSNLENAEKDKDKPNFDFLNNGTNTPHYWFYRLEYYLLISNYSNNNESYRFRYVNSVEHVLAQNDSDGLSEDGENQKVLNNFGNLALITDSENSTFSNKVFTEKKRIFNNYKDKDKKIISLKLLDVYEKSEEWKKTQIEDHQKAMLGVLQKSFENT